jgi:hypothetical protein
MNIKVNLQDGTPAQFKTEIVDGSLVVTVVSEEEKKDLFPKWEELGEIKGHWIQTHSGISLLHHYDCTGSSQNLYSTSDLARAALATARVSQTYRRYRELVGEVRLPETVRFGLILMAFRNEEDWFAFRKSNEEDFDLILKVQQAVQL